MHDGFIVPFLWELRVRHTYNKMRNDVQFINVKTHLKNYLLICMCVYEKIKLIKRKLDGIKKIKKCRFIK